MKTWINIFHIYFSWHQVRSSASVGCNDIMCPDSFCVSFHLCLRSALILLCRMFSEPAAHFLTHYFKHSIGSLLSSRGPTCPLFVLHLINSPSASGKFCAQHCISSPSEATIKYKRIQIAQGPSCETDPLSLFADFLLVAPITVGVNLTCIRSKLVKKHSSMREAISKIFSKGGWERNGDVALSLRWIYCNFGLTDCMPRINLCAS